MTFYHFRQNNSGGSFDINENVCENVIIEADDSDEANYRAKKIGIYFDGVDKDFDCPCCGDRWHPVDSYDASDAPEIYGKPIFELWDFLNEKYYISDEYTGPECYLYCIVYYKDKRKISYYLNKKKV